MSGCSALVQQCNQVGVANCVACSLPDKTLIIPTAAAAAAVIPMPGSLSFKLTIKNKLHLVGAASSGFGQLSVCSRREIVNGDYDLATGDDGSFYCF